jgi:hypothetical protein
MCEGGMFLKDAHDGVWQPLIDWYFYVQGFGVR